MSNISDGDREHLRKWAASKTRWTLAEINHYQAEIGYHYFDRETMRFWGETMRCYSVRHEGGKVHIYRIRKGRRDNSQPPGFVGEFDRETGRINKHTETKQG